MRKKRRRQKDAVTQTTDKLVAAQWCTVDNISDNLQIVTRYQFNRGTPNKTNISYLRISDNGSPIIYNVEKDYEWVPKTDDFVWSDRYSVELIEDGLNVSSLDSTSKQKAIFEQVLKKNPNLKATGETFNPNIALSVKSRSLLSAKDSEQVLYPCSSYAPSFTASEPVRPIMEFNVFFGQSFWEFDYDLRQSGLAKAMSFQLPMDQLNTSDTAVEGSSWCSWFQMDNDRFMMNIVTFGKDKFIQLELTEIDFRDDYVKNDKLFSDLLETSKIFLTSENQKYLKGEEIENFDLNNTSSSFKVQKMFASMKDSKGTEVLVEMNPYNPESTSLRSFKHIYFKCDDPRPLEMNQSIKKNLHKVLEQQNAKLGL